MQDWLLTSTFYGQWLPGDEAGSVTNVRDRRPNDLESPTRTEHDNPGKVYEGAIPGLHHSAEVLLKGPPVAVDVEHAEQLLEQFQETCKYRGWELHAGSIMFNHVHLVVEAPTAAGKVVLLRDIKAYGSRRLNRMFGERASETWWTSGGSCRPIKNRGRAIHYVCHRQPKPLLVWSKERGRIPPEESHPDNVHPGD